MLKAFCRVAPSVRLSDFAIAPAGLFFLAMALRARTCSPLQATRFRFFGICNSDSKCRRLIAAIDWKMKRRETAAALGVCSSFSFVADLLYIPASVLEIAPYCDLGRNGTFLRVTTMIGIAFYCLRCPKAN
jgi:hypothetical protein